MTDIRKVSERDASEEKEMSPTEVTRRQWSVPGGEELAMQEAQTGAEADVDDKSDLVAAESAATVEHIGNAHIDEGLSPYRPVEAAASGEETDEQRRKSVDNDTGRSRPVVPD